MSKHLEAVAESQGQWSATASALKKRYDRARLMVFALSTSAALLAAVSSQADDRSTARRLRDELERQPPNSQPRTPEWSAFVERCETILREENNSWIAKFSKPA